jgi:hypothetical protein
MTAETARTALATYCAAHLADTDSAELAKLIVNLECAAYKEGVQTTERIWRRAVMLPEMATEGIVVVPQSMPAGGTRPDPDDVPICKRWL